VGSNIFKFIIIYLIFYLFRRDDPSHAGQVLLAIPGVSAGHNPVILMRINLRAQVRNVHGPTVINVDHLGRLMLDSLSAVILRSLGPLRMEVQDSFKRLIAKVIILHVLKLLAHSPISLPLVLATTTIKVGVIHRPYILRYFLQSHINYLFIIVEIQVQIINFQVYFVYHIFYLHF
jgi:hypothetical protein